MKGQNKISLNGKEIPLKFTVGVLEDVQEYLDSENIEGGLQSALDEMKMKPLRVFISSMAKYAGEDIDPEEFKHLEFSELTKAIKLIEQATGDLPEGKGVKGEK